MYFKIARLPVSSSCASRSKAGAGQETCPGVDSDHGQDVERTLRSTREDAPKPRVHLGLSDGRPIRAIGVLALAVASSNYVAALSLEIRPGGQSACRDVSGRGLLEQRRRLTPIIPFSSSFKISVMT